MPALAGVDALADLHLEGGLRLLELLLRRRHRGEASPLEAHARVTASTDLGEHRSAAQTTALTV
jgi:hypothetical protein